MTLEGAPVGRTIVFSLPLVTPSLNTFLRMSRWARSARAKQIAGAVRLATFGLRPPAPFEHARVRIVRFAPGVALDRDNLVGGVKMLIDALTTPTLCAAPRGQIPRMRNKRGLGLIVDDSPNRMLLEVLSGRGLARTVVTIEELLP